MKYRYIVLSVGLMAFALSSVFAQTKKPIELDFHSGPPVYDPTSGVTSQPPGKYKFRLQGESRFRSVGSGGKNIRSYLKDCPEALKHLDTYKSKKTAGTVIGVLAGASFLAFAVTNFSEKNLAKEGTQGGVLLGFTVLGGIITTGLVSGANTYVARAVGAYNKSLEGKPQSYFRPFDFDRDRYVVRAPLSIGLSIPIR